MEFEKNVRSKLEYEPNNEKEKHQSKIKPSHIRVVYTCQEGECNKQCDGLVEFTNHCWIAHNVTKDHSRSIGKKQMKHAFCEFCNKQFISLNPAERLRSHVQNIHTTINLNSVKKEKQDVYQTQVAKGKIICKPKINYTCEEDKCNVNCKSLVAFTNHYLNTHCIPKDQSRAIAKNQVKSVNCHFCDKEIYSLNPIKSMRLHMKTFHLIVTTGFIEDEQEINSGAQVVKEKKQGISKEIFCKMEQEDLYNINQYLKIKTIPKETNQSIVKKENQCLYCDFCGKKYSSTVALKEHIKYVHIENTIKSLVCKFCGKEFKSKNPYKVKESLTAHIKYVHTEISVTCLQCTLCGKEFKSKIPSRAKDHLRRHVQYVHEKIKRNGEWLKKEQPKSELCSLCGKSVTMLKHHVDRVHGTESLPCQYCGKTLKSSFSLKNHITYCKMEACSVCGKILNQTRVKDHMLLYHSPYEMRPYNCSYCDIRYIKQRELDGHVRRVHLKIRPFPCNICPKSFFKAHDATSHMKYAHSNNRLYDCEKCCRTYKRKEHLERHRQEVHSLLTKENVQKQLKLCLQTGVDSGNIKQET